MGIVAVNVYFELCPALYYEWREEVREEWEEEGGVGVEVGQYDFVGGVVELGVLGLERGQKGRAVETLRQEFKEHLRTNIVYQSNKSAQPLNPRIAPPVTHIIAYTTRDIAEDEELFMNYGRKSNLELIVNYGFVVQGNEDDVLEVGVRVGVAGLRIFYAGDNGE